ncbi:MULTISPECIES: hypothetical protein [unclassified Oceanispirochaeta]|nr:MULTISPECIES: hypothetical protein [unclassified Oceanispirochaeta]
MEFKPQNTASAGPGDSNESEDENLKESIEDTVEESLEEVLI